ncbi:NADH dehydrogenase [ubiquinone] 1 alpha subcomplex assembly factor 3-like [Rhopilema esculentum]|uniref:NADH dehydrogenase [ubiquinone] 1 alpha subcomplex assembly factor 3-like n=1 Tax=Rhopilema esculentum TaxID=499914 RepID=UPI0031D04EE6
MGCNCATVNYFRKVSSFARQCCFHASRRPFMQPSNFRARQDMPQNRHIRMFIHSNYKPRKASYFMDIKMLIDNNNLLRKLTGIFSRQLENGSTLNRCIHSTNRIFKNTNDSINDQTMEPREEDKTQIKIINEQKSDSSEFVPFISKYSTVGFNIGKNKVVGSVAILPKGILSWKVLSHHQITPESLSLFTIIQPRIEILVLGVGDKVVQLPNEIWKFAKENDIALEVLDTPNACATFNFLTEEGRRTAAALIPPQNLKP